MASDNGVTTGAATPTICVMVPVVGVPPRFATYTLPERSIARRLGIRQDGTAASSGARLGTARAQELQEWLWTYWPTYLRRAVYFPPGGGCSRLRAGP